MAGKPSERAGAVPRFPIVVIDAAEAEVEDLGVWLFELGALGVEVQDDGTMSKGPGGDRTRLVASFQTPTDAEEACKIVLQERAELACYVDEIVGDGWRDKYKEHFKAFALTKALVVAPPWENYVKQPGERVLIMDPGRAFGTGLHATTSMVSKLLEKHADKIAGARVLDVGTGSGILSLVSLCFGANRCVAIDNDSDVIEIAIENAQQNGFGDAMHVSDTALEHIDGAFDAVVANIRSEVLIGMVDDLAARAKPGALTVLSGILLSESDGVRNAFGSAFRLIDEMSFEGEGDAWVAMALVRS